MLFTSIIYNLVINDYFPFFSGVVSLFLITLLAIIIIYITSTIYHHYLVSLFLLYDLLLENYLFYMINCYKLIYILYQIYVVIL